ncbi:MAG: septum site-determining protein MinC [Cyanobacteria bacterium J06638_7]
MQAAAMGAVLLGPRWQGAPGWLVLPPQLDSSSALELVERALQEASLLGEAPLPEAIALAPGPWPLRVEELRGLAQKLAAHGARLVALCSDDPRSRVAAAALGLRTCSPWPTAGLAAEAGKALDSSRPGLTLKRGTLRSGDHLEAEASVLVLGDVNPGARVSAGGHVLVWGRLRGMAHAGCKGDGDARIVALQLRPLQLRIAGSVARGPEDSPLPGMAEQASLVNGMIRLDPAPPVWPLESSPPAGRSTLGESAAETFGLNLPRPQAKP